MITLSGERKRFDGGKLKISEKTPRNFIIKYKGEEVIGVGKEISKFVGLREVWNIALKAWKSLKEKVSRKKNIEE